MNFKEFIFELLAPKAKPAEFLIDGATLYGDSIMYGGIGKNLLEAGYTSGGKVLQDLSLPGDTAKNLWHRIPYELRSTKCVVVEQGTNDISNGVNPVPYLRKIVKYLKAEGRTVVLTGLSHRDDKADLLYSLQIHQLAWEEGVQYASWPSITGKTIDGLHPDAEMTKALAATIYPLI